jgi:predicted nuclease of predicted toxin-antitoxin system
VRILADENFPRSIVETLRREGHGVMWVRGECPGEEDHHLLERAEVERRIIFTLDKDFYQIALQRRIPIRECGVVLFRVFPAYTTELMPFVQTATSAEGVWEG